MQTLASQAPSTCVVASCSRSKPCVQPSAVSRLARSHHVRVCRIPSIPSGQRGQSRLTCMAMSPGGPAGQVGLNPELRSTIDSVVSTNKVVVFMKGTPQFPQCGFSNTVVQILRSMNVPFEGVNILADDRLRSGMKEYSQWPTFPQVYVAGEFVGGADILIQMYQSGELLELFERELNS